MRSDTISCASPAAVKPQTFFSDQSLLVEPFTSYKKCQVAHIETSSANQLATLASHRCERDVRQMETRERSGIIVAGAGRAGPQLRQAATGEGWELMSCPMREVDRIDGFFDRLRWLVCERCTLRPAATDQRRKSCFTAGGEAHEMVSDRMPTAAPIASSGQR